MKTIIPVLLSFLFLYLLISCEKNIQNQAPIEGQWVRSHEWVRTNGETAYTNHLLDWTDVRPKGETWEGAQTMYKEYVGANPTDCPAGILPDVTQVRGFRIWKSDFGQWTLQLGDIDRTKPFVEYTLIWLNPDQTKFTVRRANPRLEEGFFIYTKI